MRIFATFVLKENKETVPCIFFLSPNDVIRKWRQSTTFWP